MNENEIKKYFTSRNLNQEAQNYLNFHAKRFADLLNRVKDLKKSNTKKELQILDIGPSFFTELLIENFKYDAISAMGFPDEDKYRGGHLPPTINLDKLKKFYELNLNQIESEKFSGIKFDLIILAEVIEHLSSPPECILKFLKTLLTDNGYLIIQTPNAVAIDKRIAMLRGINPFEKIRDDNYNPGHFREYTTLEL